MVYSRPEPGDEVVAFYPEQIKRTDNKTPPPTRTSDTRGRGPGRRRPCWPQQTTAAESTASRGGAAAGHEPQRRIRGRRRPCDADGGLPALGFAGSGSRTQPAGPLLKPWSRQTLYLLFDAGGRPIMVHPNAAYAVPHATRAKAAGAALPARSLHRRNTADPSLRAKNPADGAR